jgi:hypothetical protein
VTATPDGTDGTGTPETPGTPGTPAAAGGGVLGAIRNASTRTKAIAGAAAALVVIGVPVGVIAAGSGGDGKSAASSSPAPLPTTSTTATTPTPTPTPTTTAPPPVAATDPLNGGKPSSNPVFAVKVADTVEARPQVNIDKADIVYVEQVEGGLTRLAAVFHSTIPSQVEPVRSVRPQDMDLLQQYGPIGFVASGGNSKALRAVRASKFAVSMEDFGSSGFHRDGNRSAPYNVVANLTKMKKGSKAKSIGWTFNAAGSGAAGATKATAIHTRVGGTPVDFEYFAATQRWVRTYHGSPDRTSTGVAISAQNVIVQFCDGYADGGNRDAAGNPVWYTITKGTGKVAVFRDGQRIDGTWSRAKYADGTSLRDAQGHPIALKPGRTWVLLVTKGTALS